MALSKKRAPVSMDTGINRVVQTIYDDINEIINAVNQGDTTTEKKTFEGKSGDLRLIKSPVDDKYYLEGKSDEGWVRSLEFTFREKD